MFISHDIDAKEVSEDQFFGRGSGGGTMISSALDLCLEIINSRYHPSSWNIYSFHCSDGENWPSDNEKAIALSRSLKEICQLYGYLEIIPEDEKIAWQNNSTMSSIYGSLSDDKFKIVKLEAPHDIWPEFRRIFGGTLNV